MSKEKLKKSSDFFFIPIYPLPCFPYKQYKIFDQLEERPKLTRTAMHMVLKIDDKKVAHLQRWDDGTPIAEDEYLFPDFHPWQNKITIPDLKAAKTLEAHFAVVKFNKKKEFLFTGLADANKQIYFDH